jgi:anaerobic selenocysteine-containing dehydrogenase
MTLQTKTPDAAQAWAPTRRTFLQGSAALVAAATGGPALSFFARVDAAQAQTAVSVGKWMSSTCQGCTSWCPVQVKVVDGRAVHLRGNPNAKANHGKICPRPHLALQQVYDPDRVRQPMKRTNPVKGRDQDPGFVPISWDEAMDIIADKIMELRNAGEPEKFMLLRGRYTYMRDIIYSAMPKIIGSPNNISHSAICAEAQKFGAYYVEGLWDYHDYDLEHTRYVLCWGADPVSSNRQVPHAINFWGPMRDKATVAVVDPRLSATAAKANEWLPVIPGEDSALAVAMAHVMLAEGAWNKAFVGDFHDGVNRFVPGQAVPEQVAQAPAESETQTDAGPLAAAVPAPMFNEIHTSGVVKWWNIELKDRTPEWAEQHTGIPAAQIRRVALGFAAAAPRAISWVSPGAAMQARGGYAAMAAHALNGLVGSIDAQGGVVAKGKDPTGSIPDVTAYQDELAVKHSKMGKIDQRGTLAFPALTEGKSGGGVVTNATADGMLAKSPNEIKVAIAYWANFPFSCSGVHRWEKALSELPFLAHITTNASEMTQFADVVLPAPHQLFEKWGYIKNKQNLHSYISLNVPVIKPLADVRQDETEVPWLLAEKLAERGFDNLIRYYREEFAEPETGEKPKDSMEFTLSALKILTRGCWDSTHENYGKYGDKLNGWEDFREKGVWNSNRFEYGKQIDAFKTKTKKVEFYSDTLKEALTGHAEKHGVTVDAVMEATNYTARGELAFVPHFEPALRHGDPADYPLVFFEHRSRLNREGRSANTPWYQAHKNADPGDENWDDVLKMNPADAAKLGLRNGEMVKVSSTTGSITVRLKLWEGVRPGTVAKCYGQGHWAYGRVATRDYSKKMPRGGNNNEILYPEFERLSGSTARHGGQSRVKVERA